jgi:hypothetical protein
LGHFTSFSQVPVSSVCDEADSQSQTASTATAPTGCATTPSPPLINIDTPGSGPSTSTAAVASTSTAPIELDTITTASIGYVGKASRKTAKICADSLLYESFAPPVIEIETANTGVEQEQVSLSERFEKEFATYDKMVRRRENMKYDKEFLLSYWQACRSEVPLIADMALALHALPAGTASIERMFSFSGDAVRGKRNSVGARQLEDEMMVALNTDFIDFT